MTETTERTTEGKGHWPYVLDLRIDDLVFAERRAVAIKGGNPNTVTRANVLEHARRRMGEVKGAAVATEVKNDAGVQAARVGTKKMTVFGLPRTAVLRWMGAAGWSFTQAAAVLSKVLGEVTSMATVRAQVYSGRLGVKGPHGTVPKLTRDQQKQLTALLPKE